MRNNLSGNRGISVIICCYNSGERLEETLKHLAAQRVPESIGWEVIVVDNASTDGTAAIARQTWDMLLTGHADWQLLSETRPGKNHALLKGIAHSRYDYFIVCDDDNWLSPDYVATGFELINSAPSVAVVGGCGVFESEQPVDPAIVNLKQYYINGPQPWATTEHWVYGAGAVCRRTPFVPLLSGSWPLITPGRTGDKLNGGEDAELCFMAFLQGYQIISDDRLLFRHFVPRKRQSVDYILDVCYWQSYSNALLFSYFAVIKDDIRNFKRVINGWLWALIKSAIKRHVLGKVQTSNSLSFEEQKSAVSRKGTFDALRLNRSRIIDHHYRIKALSKK